MYLEEKSIKSAICQLAGHALCKINSSGDSLKILYRVSSASATENRTRKSPCPENTLEKSTINITSQNHLSKTCVRHKNFIVHLGVLKRKTVTAHVNHGLGFGLIYAHK